MTQARAPAPPPPSDEPAARLACQMQRLHGVVVSRMMRDVADQMQEDELSFSQVATLFHLRHAGQLTVSQLAAQTRLSVPAGSHLVERLVRRGLVARSENPENRREKWVVLTSQGQRHLIEMQARTVAAYTATLAGVPAPLLHDAERALAALYAHLRPEDPA